ncbi:Cell adhesion molecule Dscam2, partial [Acropora cervicornis]
SPQGYCKHILGNLPVFVTKQQLQDNELNIKRYDLMKMYFKSENKPGHFTGKLRQSCELVVDDIYCHYYFNRCYISSAPQPVCREFCEDTFLKVCDQEIKFAEEFNRRSKLLEHYTLGYWDIIDCTTLPYWNQTSNCYYADVIQAPSSPPLDFRGYNLSSTSIKVTWGDVPKSSVNGILLGYHVTCILSNSSEVPKIESLKKHSGVLSGLKKYRNYTCSVRAYNNFGNGTWSEKLVISTDEDVPSAPPQSLKAWNLSSTSLSIQWTPIPFGERNGRFLGYIVELKPAEGREGERVMKSFTIHTNTTVTGLKKYFKYKVEVRGLTQRGEGPIKAVTVQTDEDGASIVQLEWSPVPPEYANGKVLGYKMMISGGNGTSGKNKTIATTRTFNNIERLTPSTNYSFQVLAFTAKGDGARSGLFFAKTGPGEIDTRTGSWIPTVTPKSRTIEAGVITAAVLSSMGALAAILIAAWFIKYKKRAIGIDDIDGNGPRPAADVQPYATSSPHWLETIISPWKYHYERFDDDNFSIPSQRPRCYCNIAPDGLVNLPPHLKNIFLEFERYYENTRYKRLRRYVKRMILLPKFFSRRRYRLFGQTPGDAEGHLLYDRLQREMPARSVSSLGFNISADKTPATEFHGEHRRRWTSLDELRFHREPVYDEIVRCESPEMGAEMVCTLKRHRRRFSIDLGEIREFIGITEEMLSSAEENTASFTELETFEREDI